MRIRGARAEDLPGVLAVERASFGDAAWTEAMFRDELDRPGGVFLVLEQEGLVLGHAVGRVLGDEAEILEIGVDPRSRRSGFGGLLLRALEEALVEAGARACWLEVRADNAAARGLYTRSGYVEAGRRPRYYPDGQDAVLMVRALVSC